MPVAPTDDGFCPDDVDAATDAATDAAADADFDATLDGGCPDSVWYRDVDGDGYGVDDDTSIGGCTPPEGYAETSGDCDDDPAINPGATELCDGIDTDCSDGGASPAPDEDYDGDGVANVFSACSGGPLPKVDCNDRDARVRPDQTTRFYVPHCIRGAEVGCWLDSATEWSCAFPRNEDGENCDVSAEMIGGASTPSWDFDCDTMLEPEEAFSFECACTMGRCGEPPEDGGFVAGPAEGPATTPTEDACGALVMAGQCVAGGFVAGSCGGIGGASCVPASTATSVYRVRCL